jgi:hypothetical protein
MSTKNYSATMKNKTQGRKLDEGSFISGLVAGTGLTTIVPMTYAQKLGILKKQDLDLNIPKEVIGAHNSNARRMLSTKGFVEDVRNIPGIGTDKAFYNPSKNRTVYLDFKNNFLFRKSGPHMQPSPADLNTRMVRVGKGVYSSPEILSHELGHSLQSTPLLAAYGAGRILNGLSIPVLAGVGSIRYRDPEKQNKIDRYAKYGVGIGTLAGLLNVGVELDASYKGYKMLRDSGLMTPDAPLSKKLAPFVGIPTYLAVAAAPAAAYYGSRYLPEKIKGLYDRLKNRKTQENQGPKGE